MSSDRIIEGMLDWFADESHWMQGNLEEAVTGGDGEKTRARLQEEG